MQKPVGLSRTPHSSFALPTGAQLQSYCQVEYRGLKAKGLLPAPTPLRVSQVHCTPRYSRGATSFFVCWGCRRKDTLPYLPQEYQERESDSNPKGDLPCLWCRGGGQGDYSRGEESWVGFVGLTHSGSLRSICIINVGMLFVQMCVCHLVAEFLLL